MCIIFRAVENLRSFTDIHMVKEQANESEGREQKSGGMEQKLALKKDEDSTFYSNAKIHFASNKKCICIEMHKQNYDFQKTCSNCKSFHNKLQHSPNVYLPMVKKNLPSKGKSYLKQ